MKASEQAQQLQLLLQPLNDERADAARLDELRRILTKLDAEGAFRSKMTGPASQKWRAFLTKCRKEVVDQLVARIENGKRTAIRTLFGVITGCPVTSHSGQKLLSCELLGVWARAVVHNPLDLSIQNMIKELVAPYRDAQYYLLLAVAQHASSIEDADHAQRMVHVLTLLPIVTTPKELQFSQFLLPPTKDATAGDLSSDSDASASEDDASVDSDDQDQQARPSKRQKKDIDKKLFPFQRISSHRRAWLRAWLAVLQLPQPMAALKQALQYLPFHVLPHVSQPLLFADFFTAAYRHRGIISILALDGLFCLMTQHGLEYKDFYKQLYACVTTQSMYVKYRDNFFRLLDKCLSRNDMLPAHVVAAFSKRLLRCSLGAPPSSILFTLALVSNLLRKHPEMACLIHREGDEDMTDGFNPFTDDPEQANALQSSLWELDALSRHYYPAVVTLAKSVGREDELQTPLHRLDDFFVSYKSMFEQERKRKRKTRETPLAYVEPKNGLLGGPNDVLGGFLQLPGQEAA